MRACTYYSCSGFTGVRVEGTDLRTYIEREVIVIFAKTTNSNFALCKISKIPSLPPLSHRIAERKGFKRFVLWTTVSRLYKHLHSCLGKECNANITAIWFTALSKSRLWLSCTKAIMDTHKHKHDKSINIRTWNRKERKKQTGKTPSPNSTWIDLSTYFLYSWKRNSQGLLAKKLPLKNSFGF